MALPLPLRLERDCPSPQQLEQSLLIQSRLRHFILDSCTKGDYATLDYIAVLQHSIAELVKRFQYNPFDFLYERDLQATLFTLPSGANILLRTDSTSPSSILGQFAPMIKALWQVEGLKNDAFWNQHILAAVEIKYCQLGDRPSLRKAESTVDIEKLKRYLEERDEQPFFGISLTFIQSPKVPKEFMGGAKLDKEAHSGLARYVVSRDSWQRFSV